MLLCKKDPWMQTYTTLMAIPLLMSMIMLVVVRIPLSTPLLPPPPLFCNFKPSNFISNYFCFVVDFVTLGIFLHVHPFLHYRFPFFLWVSFFEFYMVGEWDDYPHMQVLMLGNFSPLYVTCSRKPPCPSLYIKFLLLVTKQGK